MGRGASMPPTTLISGTDADTAAAIISGWPPLSDVGLGSKTVSPSAACLASSDGTAGAFPWLSLASRGCGGGGGSVSAGFST
uniref:Uncharacterized protein n=1 Tax=Rhizophora mucronata TaxID=61149 RepID=A0A2P2NTK9_RHIMU